MFSAGLGQIRTPPSPREIERWAQMVREAKIDPE
jgi:hypothetical protein